MGKSSYGQITRLTLNFQDVSIENVLDEIENQSEFYFLYNQKLVDTERKVNVQISKKKIWEALDQLFAETTTTYVVMDRQIVLSPEEFFTDVKAALQSRTITGTILDSYGEPLIGATIFIKGTTTGAVTDLEGKYSISAPDDATLVFSYVGYLTQEIEVGNQSIIDISLGVDVLGIEEVVVVGYGTMRRSDLTGAVVTADLESFRQTANTNIAQSLQGTVPGLNVGVSTTQGSEPSMSIRGFNSLSGSASPLIVLDEVIFRGRMVDINPEDIESLTVLKDASAAAMYWSQAANGVIIIISLFCRTSLT